MSSDGTLGLGLLGCGSFGAFCMETYSRLPGLRPAAVADAVPAAADRLAGRFGVPAVYDAADLFARDDVDIVHLATPPQSHHPLALAALRAGKHVLCEKPLATRLADADELVAEAARQDRICPVNFVLRYNPVTDAVKAIDDSGLIGGALHGAFENFAGDTRLGPDHWFWDPAISGGIFIEHGVHFFDLYAHWFGPAEVLDAHGEIRPGSGAQDRVMCTTRHPGGVTVHYYHGFDQPDRLDRQSHHLLFERGDLYVYGWIPERLALDAIVDDDQAAGLAQLCPGAEVEVVERYSGDGRHCHGRWQDYFVTQRLRLTWDGGADKDTLYRRGVADLMRDQLAYLADPRHTRRVVEADGRDAVAVAAAARKAAEG